jgi:hypothetical protein
MNARFTGITALRAEMGFPEVESCIKSWLGYAPADPLQPNTRRVGVRQTADRVVDVSRIANKHAFSPPERFFHSVSRSQLVLLITGSTGLLGRALFTRLVQRGNYRIVTLDQDKARGRILPGRELVESYDWEDLHRGVLSLGRIDRICHLGFARPHRGVGSVAESLRRTYSLFGRAVQHGVGEIVNISSQSVYGTQQLPP